MTKKSVVFVMFCVGLLLIAIHLFAARSSVSFGEPGYPPPPALAYPVITRLPTSTPGSLSAEVFPEALFPVLAYTCEPISPKRALAWAGYVHDNEGDGRVCIQEGAYATTWDDVGQVTGVHNLIDLPMLWNENTFQHWKSVTDPQSTGIQLGPNECDQETQCNMSVSETAQLVAAANDYCPGCQWVSPSYSMARQCEDLSQFFALYASYGGDLDSFIAIGVHLYTHAAAPIDPAAILNRCRQILPSWTANLPFWITEAGIVTCDANDPTTIETELESLYDYLEIRQDVEYYFAFGPHYPRTKACDFLSFFDWNTNAITPAGRVVTR